MRRALTALVLLAATDVPVPAQQPVSLAFATLDTGSAWYVYGATMAEILRKALPPGSNIDVKPRAGGVRNPRLVAKSWGGSMQHAGYLSQRAAGAQAPEALAGERDADGVGDRSTGGGR